MYRILLEIPLPWGGVLPVYAYGALLAVGFIAATWLAGRRGKTAGLPADIISDVALYGVIAGVLGARAAFVVFDLAPGAPLAEWFRIWDGGLTFQGGLLAGVLTTVVYVRMRRVPLGTVVDCFAPALALGIAFGRMGCFLNGCCWGKVCAAGFPLGVRFPEDSFAADYHRTHWESLWPSLQQLGYGADAAANLPLPVHPAQLYTVVLLVGLCFLLMWAEKKIPRRPAGEVFVWFLAGYSVQRFIVELIRDDTPLLWAWGSFPGLRLGQILALATLLVAIGLWVYLRRGFDKARTETTFDSTDVRK